VKLVCAPEHKERTNSFHLLHALWIRFPWKPDSLHTCHAVALHAAHFVLCFQRGQKGGADGDAIHHGAELEDDGLLLQAFGELGELVGLHGGLIDAGCLVRRLWGGGVLPVRRLTEIIENN